MLRHTNEPADGQGISILTTRGGGRIFRAHANIDAAETFHLSLRHYLLVPPLRAGVVEFARGSLHRWKHGTEAHFGNAVIRYPTGKGAFA